MHQKKEHELKKWCVLKFSIIIRNVALILLLNISLKEKVTLYRVAHVSDS